MSKSLICADIHDNILNLQRMLDMATVADCDSIICCGDLCAPFIIKIIASKFSDPVHIVFGNNDGDRFNIGNAATRQPQRNITIHGECLIKEKGTSLAGIPDAIGLAVIHYPDQAMAMAKGNPFDAVMHGHTHRVAIEQIGNTLLINPGAVMGYDPAGSGTFIDPTCVIMNWETLQADIIQF